MSGYKGLFTYDIDNHRYISVEQADGIIDCMNYQPEPKTCWYLDCNGEPIEKSEIANYYNPRMKKIGNYFSSREEAEKAVERLRAWKRLKDKGLKISAKIYQESYDKKYICLEANYGVLEGDFSDVLICFGGEDD